jgi:hypothetical protein
MRDDGAFCAKGKEYGRGAGKMNKKNCGSNCEKNAGLWYKPCREGYKNFGCCICSPKCPSGMTDIGVSCAKASYGRTAGKPMICKSDEQQDAGLCYPYCRTGYNGVGPVCWGQCPSDTNKCGGLCQHPFDSCSDYILDSTLNVIMSPLDPFGLINGFSYPACN